MSHRSLGENMVFEKLLEFMFGLEKEQNVRKNDDFMMIADFSFESTSHICSNWKKQNKAKQNKPNLEIISPYIIQHVEDAAVSGSVHSLVGGDEHSQGSRTL